VSTERLDALVAELALVELGEPVGLLSSPARFEILREIERARIELRRDPTVELAIPIPVPGARPRRSSLALPRSRIYQATQSATDAVIVAARSALTTVGIHPKAIGAVIVAGSGGTFPPLVGALTAMTGKEPLQSVSPNEVITLGLAELCEERVSGGAAQSGLLLASIGIGLPGGRFKPLLNTGAKLPATVTRRQTTTRDEQTEMELTFYQGHGDNVSGAQLVGTVTLDDLPRAARAQVAVDLELHVDKDGVAIITLSEDSSGRRLRLSVPTQQTPPERRQQLARRPSTENLSDANKGKGKKGLFGRLFGR